MELADFDPSTGHRHDCPNNNPDGNIDAVCRCIGDLYVIAAEAERQMHNALMSERVFTDGTIARAVARLRVSPTVWDGMDEHARVRHADAAEPVAYAIRRVIIDALETHEDDLATAISDPGSILSRQADESVPRWSTRAVRATVAGILAR